MRGRVSGEGVRVGRGCEGLRGGGGGRMRGGEGGEGEVAWLG